MKTRAQKDKHCAYQKKYRDANRDKVNAGIAKWRQDNPAILKVVRQRASAKQRLKGAPRKRNKEAAARHRAKWRLAHPDRVRDHVKANKRRRKEGIAGIFNCFSPGCPYRVKTRQTKCRKCLADFVFPPAMTMHDRAISISDFYRTDGSLPPMHTIKSRAKKGVQWTQ